MVIDDLDIFRLAIDKAKTEPVLLVDTDAVLPVAVALQGLKPVAGGDAEIMQLLGDMYHGEFALRH